MFKSTLKSLIIVALSFSILFILQKEYAVKQTVDQIKESYTKQINCLAKNIYYEAATEPYEGKLAVAQVTINRTNHPAYPGDVCDVVYQKTGETCQFTWTCENVSKIKDKYIWEECLIIAKKAIVEPKVHDEIAEKGVLFYHAVYVNPEWKNMRMVKKIGNHIFYRKV